MRRKALTLVAAILAVALTLNNSSADVNAPAAADAVELVRSQDEFSAVRIEPARSNGTPGLAVIFQGTHDLHYYAKNQTAPGGFNLEINAESPDLEFDQPIFPEWEIFRDPIGQNVEVYAGNFTVFIPIKEPPQPLAREQTDVELAISGIACTSMVCLQPFQKTLSTTIDYSRAQSWKSIALEKTAAETEVVEGPKYSLWFALALALLAGLALNIMPCVWPILPIIVMRIVEQARQSKAKSIAMGLAFCAGILLFFACLAGANIILKASYGTVLQWGDQFRNPAFVAAMALLLIALALFMFGAFTVAIPSSVTGKSGSGKGCGGAVGMGFLAAILSTPCSFGILAAAFAWAQAQNLALGTLAIMTIGIGMAAPYAILTSMPNLLKRLPRPGRWMELFKQTIGFILLIIALKLISALPAIQRTNVLYFAVALAFCIWMWGSWVTYATKPPRKWTVRIIAVLLAVAAAWAFLSPPAAEIIDWQKYDSAAIKRHLDDGKPVLIKFTADWCMSCQVVEKTVYSRDDIAQLIKNKNVTAVKADTTVKGYPATLALKNTYSEPGVPVTILLRPDKKHTRWRGMAFGDQLKAALENI